MCSLRKDKASLEMRETNREIWEDLCSPVTLLSLAEDEKEDEKEVVSGSALNMPMVCDILSAFSDFLPSTTFPGKWQLFDFSHWTPQLFAHLQQKLVDHNERKMDSVT